MTTGQRVAMVAAVALTMAGSVHAWNAVHVERSNVYLPCYRINVFVHATTQQEVGHYQAHNCETVFADHMTVMLPELPDEDGAKQVIVRNVGNVPILVGASSPDGIDGTVYGYSTVTDQPWLPFGSPLICCAEGNIYVQPQQAMTFAAMPGHLHHMWFTTGNRTQD